MARPIILGVVGDSASGKTTITKGLVAILGKDAVTHIGTDDYHKYDRSERAENGLTPLNPECNYMDIIAQHVHHLRNGEPILKPVYKHKDGTFGPPVYTQPQQFTLIEGLLGYHTPELRECYDVRVFLAPPEELRRQWKVQRDCSRRGYTTDEVLEVLRDDVHVVAVRMKGRDALLLALLTVVLVVVVHPDVGDVLLAEDLDEALRDGRLPGRRVADDAEDDGARHVFLPVRSRGRVRER